MQISVYVSATLRSFVNRKAKIELEGENIQELLERLQDEYPDSKKGLFEEDGTLRPFVSVYVNNTNILSVSGVETPVQEGDQLA